jgi:hypothetical protein
MIGDFIAFFNDFNNALSSFDIEYAHLAQESDSQ